MYERERQEREQVTERAHQLEVELATIANAGPIGALRLRRQLRARQVLSLRPTARQRAQEQQHRQGHAGLGQELKGNAVAL